MDLAIRSVDVGAYAIDTDQPEADGTLAWDSTTVIVVSVAAGDRNGLGLKKNEKSYNMNKKYIKK